MKAREETLHGNWHQVVMDWTELCENTLQRTSWDVLEMYVEMLVDIVMAQGSHNIQMAQILADI
jgi:hypothetical protein